MGISLLHAVLGVVIAIAGLVAGWWMHGRLTGVAPLVDGDQNLVRELISGLHRLSTRVTADVDEHNTRVGEVDQALASMGGHGTPTSLDALVKRLMTANQTVQSKLSATEGKLDELTKRMELHATEARTDALTGLSNRRAFGEEAARRLVEFQQTEGPFSLVIIDIDHFKQINDKYGHPFGDEVLRGISQVFLDNFRGRDLVTRYGGEEFAILLSETAIGDARRGAEAVRKIIEQTRFQMSTNSLGLTISLGVAEIQPFEGIPSLIERADQAMYSAKGAGRNSTFWHDGNMAHPMQTPAVEITEVEESHATGHATTLESQPSIEAPQDDTCADPDPKQPVAASDSPEHSGTDDERLSAEDVDMETLNNMGNKTMFCQAIRRRIAEWNRGGATFSTVLLSVDNFETISKAHGATNANIVRGVVAEAVRNGIRDMDVMACYNDLTFGLVLPDAELRNAICIGERLRKAIHRCTIDADDHSIRFTVSLGIVEVAEGDEMATLVERARGELRKAASDGGNRSGFTAGSLVAS